MLDGSGISIPSSRLAVNHLHESHHQTILQNYGVETIHTSNQGKNYADLQITIDVLTSIYSNTNIDEFFIMSNDKDMIPLLNTIRANKRNVAIITTGDKYNSSIIEFADEHITFESICSVEIEHKIVDDLANDYWNKFRNYFKKQLSNYATSAKYAHSELKHTLQNEIRYSKIMSYERATIIKQFYDAKQIFFYNYQFGTKPCIGFAPIEYKDKLVDSNIIDSSSIIPNFNIQEEIDVLYAKASKQQKSS